MRSRIDQDISRRAGVPGSRAWLWLSLIPLGLGAWMPIWAGGAVTSFSIRGRYAEAIGGPSIRWTAQINAARRCVRGFDSPQDTASTLDLGASFVDGLKSWTIFLPRPGAA